MISMLSGEEFKMLLKHKRLQVPNEDEVVKALELWVLNEKHGQEQISMVVGDINWNYVSLPCLMEIVQNQKICQN
jgi:hypothetical protein